MRFTPLNGYLIILYGIDLPTDIVGLNGEVTTKATVDQCEQFYAARTTVGINGGQGGADTSAGVQDIVDEHDSLVFDHHFHLVGLGHTWFFTASKIISEKVMSNFPLLRFSMP